MPTRPSKSGRRRSKRLARSSLSRRADALRSNQFDTVLGTIGFDENGDVTGYDTFVWFVWKDGKYAPVDRGKLID